MQALASRLSAAPTEKRPGEPVPIALVITDLDVGGAEKALVALATSLDRARWSPVVYGLGPEGALSEPLRRAGIPVFCLGARRSRPISTVLRLAALFRRQRPRLVQCFLFHANIAGRLAGVLAGVPWMLGGLRVAEHEQRWHLVLDRLTRNLAAGSVCVSQGVYRFSRDRAGLPPERLVVIPNGITLPQETSALPRSTWGLPETGHLALFVGRLEPQKGISVLLDAAELVIAGSPDWHLAIVGEGSLQGVCRDRLNRAPGLAAHVHVLGRRDDVPALLMAADVLVLPSLWEGMPNIVLEAMAAGRAVVGTRVEGTEDLVLPEETGWLVPAGDPHALAAALRAAAADPERLKRLGAAGRERVRVAFAQERITDAYDRLWSAVLGFAPAEPLSSA